MDNEGALWVWWNRGAFHTPMARDDMRFADIGKAEQKQAKQICT